jgi:hypothetical protein
MGQSWCSYVVEGSRLLMLNRVCTLYREGEGEIEGRELFSGLPLRGRESNHCYQSHNLFKRLRTL